MKLLGGNALKFYSSVRLDIRRTGAIKDKEEVIGNQTRVKIVKNKVAPPFKVIEFDIMYGENFKGRKILIWCALDIINKSGSWYSYNDQKIGQGKENAKIFLKENLDILDDKLDIRVRSCS